ncbi:MAG: TetR/AcrR family transcriptional regulator [Agitococcus sp.]|nr:TetR/AcrR family transcriptional regulator [Moraxellaceae bacterium]MBK8326490.1 TetR/AcrR family transcriptional regulator [Moraxellaceae bacterium]MBP9216279.1 TetR/AcrR family transcriptional regulator [Agitococcus sp.]
MVTKHLPANERRAITVDAVVELAAQQNPNEITTAAIAKHMGVSQGALFKHFSSKEAILQAVMEWVAEVLLSRIDAAARHAPTPIAALEAMFIAHIEFIAEHSGVPRIMFGELQRSGQTAPKRLVQTIMTRYRKRLYSLLENAKNNHEVDEQLDIDTAITMFVGTIQGLVVQSLLSDNIQHIHHQAPQVFAIYLRGIGGKK